MFSLRSEQVKIAFCDGGDPIVKKCILIFLFACTNAFADPVRDPNGTDAFFALGWAAAADKRCELNTYRNFLQLARSHGLTELEIARNAPKIVEAALQADDEIGASGLAQWCANYRRDMLTGR
jgi:hypothetical protein